MSGTTIDETIEFLSGFKKSYEKDETETTRHLAEKYTGIINLLEELRGRRKRSFNFATLQSEVGSWSRRNFKGNKPWMPLLGAVEEIGELSHSFLKREQGIRGTPEEHNAGIVDAIGDVIVYLADFCERNNISLQRAVETAWSEVSRRDWKKNPVDGKVKSGGGKRVRIQKKKR